MAKTPTRASAFRELPFSPREDTRGECAKKKKTRLFSWAESIEDNVEGTTTAQRNERLWGVIVSKHDFPVL